MTKSKLRSTLLATTMVAGGMMMGSGTAYATTGTVFNLQDNLNFDCATAAPGVGLNGFASCSDTVLEWVDVAGTGEARSFLRILPPSNTNVAISSDFGWFDLNLLQNENNIIQVSSFGFTIDLLTSILVADAANNLLFALPELELGVTFTETSNSSPCPGPNPLGSVCDDIFVVAGLDQVTGSFLFPFGGETYSLSFRVLADPLTGSFFDDANPDGGGTIYTAENFTSQLRVQARIDQIPEPGTLALLGLGLLGLPLVARRAAKKA